MFMHVRILFMFVCALNAISSLFVALMPAQALSQQIRATVHGGVAQPGMYVLEKGGRLSTLIEKAGGYTDNAWLPGAVLNRGSLKKARKEALAGLVSQAEAEAAAFTGDEDSKRSFFRSLETLEPTGRMSVPLMHLRLLKGSEKDILLEDGDILFIPQGKGPVFVTGAVRNGRSSFGFTDSADPEDYVRMAGGFAEGADRGRTYMLRADTAVPVLSKRWVRWNPERSRWEISALVEARRQVEPGDTIVVPRKPSPGSWARKARNLHNLLMQAAAMTGVVVEAP